MKLIVLQGEGDPIRGHVPFELSLSAMGETTLLDCRVNYVAKLYDQRDQFTNEPIRMIGSLTMHYEVLDWRDPNNCDDETGERHRLPVPRWVNADLPSHLPWTVARKLDDLIEEQALAQERQAKMPGE